jgi:octaprenyl-diphosphate synthase
MTPINQILQQELVLVNEAILQSLSSEVPLIHEIGQHLIHAGGKRIRPIVHLLCAHACGNFNLDNITLAAIIEFIHTATLLHDDVVDGSSIRRGRPTANHVWDNPTAVLVGDFLYSRSFQMMAQGEVLQLANRFQADLDEARYLKVINYKTAKLFEAAAELGALSSDPDTRKALRAYGHHLGLAFQLTDDYLDYQADNKDWGKEIGQDLSEGKATLPLIYALNHSSKAHSELIRSALSGEKVPDLGIIQEALSESGAFTYTLKRADEEAMKAKEAISIIPKSTYRDGLYYLATFAIARTS